MTFEYPADECNWVAQVSIWPLDLLFAASFYHRSFLLFFVGT